LPRVKRKRRKRGLKIDLSDKGREMAIRGAGRFLLEIRKRKIKISKEGGGQKF